MNMLQSLGLEQHVVQRTHERGHTLDWLISRKEDGITMDIDLSNKPISDHYLVSSRIHF